MYKSFRLFGYNVAVGSSRTHHPGIIAGVWRLASNGVQFFAGRFLLTFCWPLNPVKS